MDTPLQSILKFIREKQIHCANEWQSGFQNALNQLEHEATTRLEQERKVIIDAYNQGYRDGEMLEDSIKGDGDISEFTDAESYFTDNFTNQ